MPWCFAVLGALRPRGDGAPQGNRRGRFPSLAPPPAPSGPATRQQVPPGEILGAGDLSVDKPVNRLVGNYLSAQLHGQSPRDQLRRPALGQSHHDHLPQFPTAVQLGTGPTPGAALLVRITGPVTALSAAIAPYLPSNGRWRAIQSCRDLPKRAPRLT